MKRILFASTALSIAMGALAANAGPLQDVNQGLDDETFVYWEENKAASQADSPFAEAPVPAQPVYNLGASEDDDLDGQDDETGADVGNEYHAPYTVRTVDTIVFDDANMGLGNTRDHAYNIPNQIVEVPRAAAEQREDTGPGIAGELGASAANVAFTPTQGTPEQIAEFITSGGVVTELDGLAQKIIGAGDQPGEPEGDVPFGEIDVTTTGNILEPDVGCTLLTEAINFDFGTETTTGVSTPATVQITCGTGNEGDTLFRLSTTNQDPAGEGVDQQAASAYAVAMYNATIAGSESDPERQKNMTLVDVASGQAVATQTFAITNSGTAENIDLFAQLDDARHGGKPVPVGVADPENHAPFKLNVWL